MIRKSKYLYQNFMHVPVDIAKKKFRRCKHLFWCVNNNNDNIDNDNYYNNNYNNNKNKANIHIY